jgi:hypothetical protein
MMAVVGAGLGSDRIRTNQARQVSDQPLGGDGATSGSVLRNAILLENDPVATAYPDSFVLPNSKRQKSQGQEIRLRGQQSRSEGSHHEAHLRISL